jgi:hypothetical protein
MPGPATGLDAHGNPVTTSFRTLSKIEENVVPTYPWTGSGKWSTIMKEAQPDLFSTANTLEERINQPPGFKQ